MAYTCVRILSSSLASLPLRLYRSAQVGQKEEDTTSSLARCLSLQINDFATSYTGISTLIQHMCYTGNGFMEVVRDQTGSVQSLWSLDPRVTTPKLVDGQLVYVTKDGMATGESRVIPAADMVHVPFGTTWNGVSGHSPIHNLRESLGLAQSMARYQGQSMSNGGGAPSLVITSKHPLPLAPEAKTKARLELEALTLGPNRRRPIVLDQDVTLAPLGFNAVDLALIEQKKLNQLEIAAAFGIPGYYFDSEKLSKASATQLALQFIQDTLMPLARQISLEIKRKCIAPESPAHVCFDFRERLIGDFHQQLESIQVALNTGTMNRNEARQLLSLDPIEGPEGSYYTLQLNNTNLENMAPGLDPAIAAPEATPEPTEDSPEPTVTPRSFLPMVSDAIRRIVAGEPATRAFGPIAESLCTLRGVDDAKVLTDILTSIEKRSKQFTAENVDTMADETLTRVYKAVVHAAHAEAARKEIGE